MRRAYPVRLRAYLERGIAAGLLAPDLLEFDLTAIAGALQASRDLSFAYMGLQTLQDRYLLRDDGVCFELPRWFWMRVAMGWRLRSVPKIVLRARSNSTMSSRHFSSAARRRPFSTPALLTRSYRRAF